MSDKNDLNTLSFVKRWDHHTQSGGYDRLAHYTKGGIIKTEEIPFLKANERGVVKQLLKWVVPGSVYSNHYHFKDLFAEKKLIRRVQREYADLVHAFYAEDQLNVLLSGRQSLNAALVGTFHLPMESHFMHKLKKEGKLKRYGVLDAIITLSSATVEVLKRETENSNVFFVPHGIDTQTFIPGNNSRGGAMKSFNILTVGRHSRDWDTYVKVIDACRDLTPEITFSAVVPENISERLSKYECVTTYTSIGEEKLIELYRQADLLYMPLTYATANNSILEAMACGTPVLSTNTGGIPDYVDKESGWLVPQGGTRETVELVRILSESPEKIRIASVAARKNSLRFDWKDVAAQVEEIYQKAWAAWKKK